MRLKLYLLCLIMICTPGFCLESTVSAGEVQIEQTARTEGQRVVILAPSAPFVIELQIQVDQGDFRSNETDYIERLFQSLDQNHDQFIDLQEMENVPAFGIKRFDQGSSAQRLSRLDSSPADNRLSKSEFATYLNSAQGSAFRIAGAPSRTSQVIELFRKLDQNEDGSLSDTEFSSSSRALVMFDRDEDGVLNLAELRPFLNGPNSGIAQPVSRPTSETPFRKLDHDRSIKAVVDEMFKKYVEFLNASRDGISLKCFQQRDTDTAKTQTQDQNADGYFNREELFTYLQNPVIGLHLQVTLPRKETFRPRVQVLSNSSPRVTDLSVNSRSRIELRIDGLLLEFRVKSTRHMFADTVRFYQTRFRVADSDKNGYLNSAEFLQLNIPGTDFKKVDSNQDEMLFVEELTDFLMLDTATVQDQVVMTVDNDGTSLFEILDMNRDRRLSPRELKNSLNRVREYDGNRDRVIDPSELRGHYKITLELGKPELFVFAPRDAGMAMAQNSQVPRTSSGPLWFQRMDRNRDGDLSKREFLFDMMLFEQLDIDQDQLISPAEADSFQEMQKHNKISSGT